MIPVDRMVMVDRKRLPAAGRPVADVYKLVCAITSAEKGNNVMSQPVTTHQSAARTGYLIAAGASFALSIWLWFGGSKEQGLFVGLWVPSILSLGSLMLTGGHHE